MNNDRVSDSHRLRYIYNTLRDARIIKNVMPFPITLTSYRASSEVGVSRRARSRTTTSSPPPRASVFLAASRTSRNRREKDAGNRIDAPVSLGQHITTVSRRSFGVRGDDAAAPLGSAGRNSQLVETSLRAAYRPTVP